MTFGGSIYLASRATNNHEKGALHGSLQKTCLFSVPLQSFEPNMWNDGRQT